MTETEARERAATLNESAGADTRWIATRAGGEWEVVRVSVPGLERADATGTRTEVRPRPEAPDDPRPSLIRNVPPYGPGI